MDSSGRVPAGLRRAWHQHGVAAQGRLGAIAQLQSKFGPTTQRRLAIGAAERDMVVRWCRDRVMLVHISL